MEKNLEYFSYKNFCLRTPTLSLDSLYELNRKIDTTDLTDPQAIKALIEDMFSNLIFKEAIYTSSKALYQRWEQIKSKEKLVLDEQRRMLQSLYKYYSRMSHRSTPYGLFAGYTSGSIADASNIEFKDEPHKPRFQFNIQSITAFLRGIDPLSPSVIDQLKYYPNNTHYILKDRVYYVEKHERNGHQYSNLTSVGLNEHIQKILALAEKGATLLELAHSIELEGVTEEQKIDYTASLISSQVLTNELWPTVSSNDFMGDFLKKAEQAGILDPRIEELQKIYEVFNNTDQIEDIASVRTFLEELGEESISNVDDFYRLDLYHETSRSQLSQKVIDQIKDISYELMIISPTENSGHLDTFKEKFHQKFEEREVPLTRAIDPNFGVGFALAVNGISEYTPLVEGIPSDMQSDNQIEYFKRFEDIRLKAIRLAQQEGKKVVNIDEDVKDWIKEVKENGRLFQSRTKSSTYTFGSIIAKSEEDLDNGNFKFKINQANAPYAGKLLSRFLSSDEELRGQAREIFDNEQKANPDAILAEVVYIPDGKYANISLTTQLRDYEITYGSSSNLPKENQINVNDLTVSIRNNRIVLRSIRLNKEVIPCITNTYDASFGNPIYQFLSMVSYQDMNHGMHWNWGEANSEAPYLPRIEYKNFILTRSRWYLPPADIDYKNDESLKIYFDQLRKERDLPRYIIIPEGDNELFIDFENAVCRQIIGKMLTQNDIIVYEFLRDPEHCFIKQKGESFTNEIILPFGTHSPMYRSHTEYNKDVQIEDRIQRIFYPGSEWLYFKIYSGTKILEDILANIISPFSTQLKADGIIDEWFFLRYKDPNYHLRVRFLRNENATDEDWFKVMSQFQEMIKSFIPEEHAVKLQLDTYQREIERYGEETMAFSESIFHADSQCIADFTSLIDGDYGEQLRWQFALVSVHELLDDFQYSLKDRKELLDILSDNFFYEFTVNSPDKGKYISKVLRDRYRENTKLVASMIEPEKRDPELAEGYECFERRSQSIRSIISSHGPIKNIELNELLASYVHMTLNRLFVVNQRKHELVIYHFLHDYYRSAIARAKYQKKTEYADSSI